MRRFLVVLLALFALSAAALADEIKSELAQTMAQIESSIEDLKQNVKLDESREANLGQVDRLILAAEKASELDPTSAREMEGEARQRFLAGYQAAMKAMVADARALRKMIDEGAEPDARYAQLMKTYRHQESGHQSFQEEKTP